MKIRMIAASAMALSAFASVAMAGGDSYLRDLLKPPTTEQSSIPQEVMKLLADTRQPAELSDKELKQRVALARKFAGLNGVSEEVRGQLAAMAEAARAELMARQQQAQPAQPQPPAVNPDSQRQADQPAQPAPAPKAAERPAPAPDQQANPVQPNTSAPLPRALVSLISDDRPVSSLSDDDLNKRVRRINQFSDLPDLDPQVAQRLREMLAEAESEQAKRQQAATPPANPAAGQAPVIVKKPRPAAPQPDTAAAPPPPPKPPVASAPPPPPPPQAQPPMQGQVDPRDTQRLDSNVSNPEAEANAQQYLQDPRPAQRLSDDQLRQRLNGIRDLLAGNELSRQSERALRQKLMTEREILRQRIAASEAAAQQQAQDQMDQQDQQSQQDAQQGRRRPQWGEEPPPNWQWSDRQALNDRRRSEDLRDYELRRRLDVYRRAAADDRYDPQYRDYWKAVIARDQYVLQQRLVQARRARQAEMAQGDQGGFNINIGIGRRPPPQDVFAAEVNDQQLADVLAAQPRRKFNRRYTIQEIEQQPEVRAALPRVELDTIKFGFNEAFVRPEEIDKLDRIGEILERILSRHPNEVFLIEGHTDAVGSDAANLVLSRKRAEAVKKALTTYYLIPPSAIRTAGYGERYLKIPTADPEPENRRVSVSRATDVIGLQ